MDSGDMDRVPLDDRMFPNDEAHLDSRIHKDNRQNEPGRSIAKEYEDLEIQKAEFKKLQEDHKRKVHEFEETKIEFEDKLRTFHKMEVENDRKLDLLRAEQRKFNTTTKAFNKRLGEAREATKVFNKKSETLRGKLMAAKRREKSFLKEYKYKQRYLGDKEQRIDAKLKHLGIEEMFFDPDGESYEYLQSVYSRIQGEREGEGEIEEEEETEEEEEEDST